MKRIAIIGPGAIGCTVAAELAQHASNSVLICARSPVPFIDVETPHGRLHVVPEVVTDPAKAGEVDWVLVATKAYDSTSAAGWLDTLRGPQTPVAILQNGVEHVDRFAPFVPRDRILPVVVDCPAERTEPGRVRQRSPAWMLVADTAAGRDFAGLFAGTHIDVKTTPDFTTAAWRKLCVNAPGAVSAITLRPAGVARDEAVAEVMRGMIREVIAVGRAEGAVLDDSIVETVIEGSRRAPPDAVNSIHADRLAGRRMEIDARNGVVVRLGRKHGIPTPFNEMAVALLRAVENPS